MSLFFSIPWVKGSEKVEEDTSSSVKNFFVAGVVGFSSLYVGKKLYNYIVPSNKDDVGELGQDDFSHSVHACKKRVPKLDRNSFLLVRDYDKVLKKKEDEERVVINEKKLAIDIAIQKLQEKKVSLIRQIASNIQRQGQRTGKTRKLPLETNELNRIILIRHDENGFFLSFSFHSQTAIQAKYSINTMYKLLSNEKKYNHAELFAEPGVQGKKKESIKQMILEHCKKRRIPCFETSSDTGRLMMLRKGGSCEESILSRSPSWVKKYCKTRKKEPMKSESESIMLPSTV